MKIRIKNAEILTMDAQDTVFQNGEIHIDGQAITYVGQTPPPFDAQRTIDARGGVCMPPFCNTHTHLPMSLFRGFADDLPLKRWLEDVIWPAEDQLDRAGAYAGTMLALCELVRGGVGAFADAYYLYDWTVQAIEKSGLRAHFGRSVVDFTPEMGEAKYQEMLRMQREYAGGRVSVGCCIHAPYTCTDGMMRRIAETAAETGSILQIHVAETKEEFDTCKQKTGKTPVAHLRELGVFAPHTVAAHCVHVTPEDMDILAERGVFVSHCPQSNLKLASGVAPVAEMLKRGIAVTLGTDSAASNNNLSVWEEMTQCALLQKGVFYDATAVDAKTALRMATVEGMRALGLGGAGLVCGAPADLILIDTSSLRYAPKFQNSMADLVYAGCDRNVTLTMVGGDILFENGEVTFCDEREVCRRAQEFVDRALV